MPYVAAACLVLVMAGYFLFYQQTPERIAANFIQETYSQLSQNMDASKDSIQLGISAYNDKNYVRALALFNGVRKKDSTNSDAKKYAGLAYLQLKDYDNALERFKELSGMKGLYSNSGDILQATTLLQRNAAGDKNAAKNLLHRVVQQKKEGQETAKKALEKF